MTRVELLYEKVMLRMDMTKETGEEELQEIIRCVIEEEGKKEFLYLSCTEYRNLILIRKFLHTEYGDNILKLLIFL